LSFENFFRELSPKQIFAKAFANRFANVVLAFAEPTYFNRPSNHHLGALWGFGGCSFIIMYHHLSSFIIIYLHLSCLSSFIHLCSTWDWFILGFTA
jgi:hypothetical protein